MIQKIRTLLSGQFTGDVLWNIASLIFLAGGGLILNGLIVSARGADALGVFNQVYAFYIVLSQFGVGGIQHSVLKEVSYHQDDLETCADSTFVALILILVITIPICFLGILIAEPAGQALDSPDVAVGMIYVMPGLIFFAGNKVTINVLNGLRRMRAYAIFRSLRFIFIPAFVIAILASNQPSNVLPLALTLAEMVLFVLLVVYIYRGLIPLRLPKNSRAYAFSHLSYGMRGMLSGALIGFNNRIDVLMLGLFLSDEIVGIYSFAAILAEGFAQLPIAVRYNVDALIGNYFAKNTLSQITELSQKIRRVFLPAMIGLGVLALLVYPILYVLLVGDDHLQTSWMVFAILIFAHVVISGYTPMRGILLQGGAPGMYTLTILIMAINNIAFNAILIPMIGVFGAALATGWSTILEIIIIVYLTRRLFHIRL